MDLATMAVSARHLFREIPGSRLLLTECAGCRQKVRVTFAKAARFYATNMLEQIVCRKCSPLHTEIRNKP